MQFTLKSFLIITALFTASVSFGQSKWQLGFGVNAGKADNDPFKNTLGGDIQVQKQLNDWFAGTFTAGFTHFFEKDHFDGYSQYGSPYNVIPVKIGAKYFFAKPFYLGAEVGAGIAFEQWGTSFLWSPSVGTAFKNGIDIGLRYEDYTRSSATKAISLRLAYNLNLGKNEGASPLIKRTKTDVWRLGFSINPGLTTESFEDFVLGTDVSLSRSLTNNFDLYFSVGYTRIFNVYKVGIQNPGSAYAYSLVSTSQNLIPVKAGLRWYANNKLYFAGEAGAAIDINGNGGFTYAPSAGLSFNNGLDLALRYERFTGYTAPNILGFKLGYTIKL